jgi:hypothetical protein
VLSQTEFEAGVACHDVTWTDDDGDVWQGVPLWLFCGWVDDRIPHGPDGFDDNQAAAGYKIIVKAGDGYAKEFASADVAWSNDYIIANTVNGTPLSKEGSHPPWPLRIIGPGAPGGKSVGNIMEIELTEFGASTEVPSVHIIKYDTDGTTAYKFEGIDFTKGDHWDQAEIYPGGYKINRTVKGTSVKDLCELVGGMGTGTEIKLVASDRYETKLGYANIYTDELTSTQRERQGEAFLA